MIVSQSSSFFGSNSPENIACGNCNHINHIPDETKKSFVVSNQFTKLERVSEVGR